MDTQLTVFDSRTPDGIKIINKDGKLITTSLNVAYVFGKRHSDVLRDIEALDCTPEFLKRNFALSSYNSRVEGSPAREYKKYEMNRDGLAFLVMGYKGKKAAHHKEAYINTFNEMEAQLQKLADPSQMTKLDWIEFAKQQEVEKIKLVASNKKLETKIIEDQPKVEFAENVAASDDALEVGQFAKILAKRGFKTGPNRLFKSLKDPDGLNLLIDTNKPRQYAIENGWIELDPYPWEDANGKIHIYEKVKITGKGQIHIERKLRKLDPAA